MLRLMQKYSGTVPRTGLTLRATGLYFFLAEMYDSVDAPVLASVLGVCARAGSRDGMVGGALRVRVVACAFSWARAVL